MRRICWRRICLQIGAIVSVAGLTAQASAQGLPDLRAPAGKEWPAIGGDWSNSRYSTLTRTPRVRAT